MLKMKSERDHTEIEIINDGRVNVTGGTLDRVTFKVPIEKAIVPGVINPKREKINNTLEIATIAGVGAINAISDAGFYGQLDLAQKQFNEVARSNEFDIVTSPKRAWVEKYDEHGNKYISYENYTLQQERAMAPGQKYLDIAHGLFGAALISGAALAHFAGSYFSKLIDRSHARKKLNEDREKARLERSVVHNELRTQQMQDRE